MRMIKSVYKINFSFEIQKLNIIIGISFTIKLNITISKYSELQSNFLITLQYLHSNVYLSLSIVVPRLTVVALFLCAIRTPVDINNYLIYTMKYIKRKQSINTFVQQSANGSSSSLLTISDNISLS